MTYTVRFSVVFVLLLLLFSCSDDDEEGMEIISNYQLSLEQDQIIDSPVNINGQVEYNQTTEMLFNIYIDDDKILSFNNNKSSFSIDLDPETYSTGQHTFKIEAVSIEGGDIHIIDEINFLVQRRLVTVNLPEGMLSPYTVNAVVFASRMDGSLISSQVITHKDRQVILRSPDEFSKEEQFMLSFSLTDNGKASGLSTHANITRENLKTLNLKTPIRPDETGITRYKTNGLVETDQITTQGYGDPTYNIYVNSGEGYMDVSEATEKGIRPQSYYFYRNYSNKMLVPYSYLLVNDPLNKDFVLDMADFTREGIIEGSIAIHTTESSSDNIAGLILIYGYLTENDFNNDVYHLTDNRTVYNNPEVTSNYSLNTNFYQYKHKFQYGKYFTEQIGAPKTSYTIPETMVNYVNRNNVVEIDIQGASHTLGRMELTNYENFHWNFTFDSQITDRKSVV